MISSTVTQARRASGLYFSKEETDPNDNVLLEKNVFFKQGALINAKVKSFNIPAPDPGIFSAINLLMSSNQNETSQVSFAERNIQRDSRKTAEAIKSANTAQKELSTVQVVLFSIALKQQYTYQVGIIVSRVLAGLIKVNQQVAPLYQRRFIVKPSGDTDVIERQQMIQMMLQLWPIIQGTPIMIPFLCDLLEKMFPDNAPKYIQMLQQAQAAQQSGQAQQMQQIMGVVQGMAQGIVNLSKHKEMFSETGVIHAFPIIQQAAQQIEQLQKTMGGQPKA